MWMASPRCGISVSVSTQTRRTQWPGTRPPARSMTASRSDMKPAGRRGTASGRAAASGPLEAGPPPDDRPARDVRRDPVHAGHGMPVAGDSQALSALCDRPEPLLSVARQRRPGTDAGRAAHAGPCAGGAFPRADGGRDRQPAGEDDRDGRAVGLRRGQEGQGRKRHLAVDVEGFPIAVRVLRRRTCRTGTGRWRRSWRCREGARGDEAVGGRRLRRAEARGRAGGARPGAGHRDRPAAQGNKGIHGPVPPPGGGADVCADVAVPAPGPKDSGRTLESSLAWAQLAACRFLMRRVARGQAAGIT